MKKKKSSVEPVNRGKKFCAFTAKEYGRNYGIKIILSFEFLKNISFYLLGR